MNNLTFEQWKQKLIQYRTEIKCDNPEDVTDEHVQEWIRVHVRIQRLREELFGK